MMNRSLKHLDEIACEQNMDRLILSFNDDMKKLQQLLVHFSFWDDAVDVMQNHSLLDEFMSNFRIEVEWNTGLEINYLAFLDKDRETWHSLYYPPTADGGQVGVVAQEDPKPLFSKEHLAAHTGDRWTTLAVAKGVEEPFLLAFEPVQMSSVEDDTVYGYMLAGRSLAPRLKRYADDVPVCLTVQTSAAAASSWDSTDMAAFGRVESGSFGEDGSYTGAVAYETRTASYLRSTANRLCPDVPLYNDTDDMVAVYYVLDDAAPAHPELAEPLRIRVDRPLAMLEQGSTPALVLSLEIIGMMLVLCIIFIVFLDCVVLQRIVKLSNVIQQQTKGHETALADGTDDSSAAATADDDGEDDDDDDHNRKRKARLASSSAAAEADRNGRKTTSAHGKKGKSSRSSGGGAHHSHTTGSSSEGNTTTSSSSARDEIGELKRAMEANAAGLRKRLEAASDSIKAEQQKAIRHRQAMQLLNVWCGRKGNFPGLRTNAMQLRYEPPRSLDDLLASPLAIEYLKTYCEESHTRESLWFLLDVSWLEELERAEDSEEDSEQRQQIHDVAAHAAETIFHSYIARNAQQPINLSAGVINELGGGASSKQAFVYRRHMFDGAVNEIKILFNTDILPRFQKSVTYTAMSETLYADSAGAGDESEYSDETVSTAGSILTDDTDGADGGVTRVFAHTFKALHVSFDPARDGSRDHTDASSTCSGDSVNTTGTTTTATTTATTTTTTAAASKGTTTATSGAPSSAATATTVATLPPMPSAARTPGTPPGTTGGSYGPAASAAAIPKAGRTVRLGTQATALRESSTGSKEKKQKKQHKDGSDSESDTDTDTDTGSDTDSETTSSGSGLGSDSSTSSRSDTATSRSSKSTATTTTTRSTSLSDKSVTDTSASSTTSDD